MEQGFTSVQDIAAMCGFNDPYYFSRVFKDHMNVSPKAHMETLEKGEKKNGLFV
jgi:AraC-like DNA-binding protein